MIKKHLYTVLAMLLVFSSTSLAQKSETVNLPDEIMQQVVSRIIRWQFKPARKPRTIPIANVRVKREWLPVIENITFDLVPGKRTSDFQNGVFFFEEVTRDGSAYSINAGWGDPECGGLGDTWKFKVSGNRVRLWPTGFGWGSGCGGSDPPMIRGLTLGEISPNELPGYEFFAKGKLKEIRLGISTREDMTRLFGSSCEGVCDYDENWTIFANYFGIGPAVTRTTYVGDQMTEVELIPKPALVGTLKFITLRPKHRISFLGVSFPRAFARGRSHAVGDAWDENGFAGAVHSTSQTYTDGYGLEYSVYEEETFNNLLDKEKSDKPPAKKGDLLGIEYKIPESLYDTICDKRPKKQR